jgi:SAM-dependent methyltransferase
MKKYIRKAVTKWGLFPIVDWLRARYCAYQLREVNHNFMTKHPDFIPPPLELAFDAYNHVNWEIYHRSGLEHAKLFAHLIKKHSVKEQSLKILDWGCGPGRLIRHMPQLLMHPQIFGVDYNKQTIKWCKKTFQDSQFFQNNLNPPLPFEKAIFDVVYGLSILTHLSEQSHGKWINELKRILKPNGILILTLYGHSAKNLLTEQESVLFAQGKLVVRDDEKEGKRNFAAFHSPAYVKDNLFSSQDILEHIPCQPNGVLDQDIWVIRLNS